jgi:general secretion pathway protein B
MSYILEALKKADRERTVGNVPDLDTVHDRDVPAGRRKTAWYWILGTLVVVNGVLFSLLLLPDHGADDGSGPASTDARPNSGIDQPAAAVDRDRARHRAAPKPYPRPQVRAYTPPAAKPDRVAAPAAQPVTPAPVPSRATETGPPATASAAVSGQAAPVTSPVAASASPQADTSQPPAEAGGGIPYWDDLSLEFRSGFTVPRIDVHVYDTNPELRFILADLKKYREGDRLENGAMLEKITPEGILLSFRGTRFIYRP